MFLVKIKQQILDNLILIVLLSFAAAGAHGTAQVKIEIKDLAEMKAQLNDLEVRCSEMERMRADMDDLRYAFAKAVTHRAAKTAK